MFLPTQNIIFPFHVFEVYFQWRWILILCILLQYAVSFKKHIYYCSQTPSARIRFMPQCSPFYLVQGFLLDNHYIIVPREVWIKPVDFYRLCACLSDHPLDGTVAYRFPYCSTVAVYTVALPSVLCGSTLCFQSESVTHYAFQGISNQFVMITKNVHSHVFITANKKLILLGLLQSPG